MDQRTTLGARPDEHADIRLWLRLLFCAGNIESRLQSRINDRFGISLARFDLLAQLERSSDGLTMTELSRRMVVSNGATTSLVDRLEEDGLLKRLPHPADRRATIIRLTARGRARFLSVAKEHEVWVTELLGPLDTDVKTMLQAGLGILKRHLEACP